MKFFFLWICCFLLSISPTSSTAQTVGNCISPKGDKRLDINSVQARILNNGSLFWNGDPAVYTVPKGGSVNAIFTSNLWIGGLDTNDKLHIAAANYRAGEFWPGPLDANGNPPADCSKYDYIYKISKEDIDTYNTSGVATSDLSEWPWQLGAPVNDGDGIANNYNLKGGDRPKMYGEQMLWWVMNDMGNVHTSTNTLPMGIEARVTAFAFQSTFPNVTFYRYQLIYKGKEALKNVALGAFVDVDLGNSSDDYVGSDSTLSLAYAYNSDENDEGLGGYGSSPPAIGHVLMKTPVVNGKEIGIGYVNHIFSGANGCTDPGLVGQEFYNVMTGRCKNGQYITEGGLGFSGIGKPIRFVFPGNPVTAQGWSEENADGKGGRNSNGDRRYVISTKLFNLKPGDQQEFMYAIIWARSTAGRFASLSSLKLLAGKMPSVIATANEQDTNDVPQNGVLLQNAPNPTDGYTTISFNLPKADHVSLKIYDLLGREVSTVIDQYTTAGMQNIPFNTQKLPHNGVYFYVLNAANNHILQTQKMVVNN